MTTAKMNGIQLSSTNVSQHVKGTLQSDLSDLARIEIKSDDPLDLFKEWHEDARKYSTATPDALCLATVSKDLKVSARHLLLRHYDKRGFVIVTDSRSRKCRELAEVPNAAMCILWSYINDRQEHISRQVRIEGNIEQLLPDEFQYLYDREPLFCKIRSHLCFQDKAIDWDEHKMRHDKLMHEVRTENKELPMPDHFRGVWVGDRCVTLLLSKMVGKMFGEMPGNSILYEEKSAQAGTAYRLSPDMMEYYFARDHLIADRLLFKKEFKTWTNQRIAA